MKNAILLFILFPFFCFAQTDFVKWNLTADGSVSYSNGMLAASGIQTAQNPIKYDGEGMLITGWNNSSLEQYRYFGFSLASADGAAVTIAGLAFQQESTTAPFPGNYTIRYYISEDGTIPGDYEYFYSLSKVLINNESIGANPVKNITFSGAGITLTKKQRLIIRFYTSGTDYNTQGWRIKANSLKLTGSQSSVPVAFNDTFTTYKDTSFPLNILYNDIQNPSVSAINITKAPLHGTVEVNGTENVNYIPSTGYTGSDSFQYNLANATGISNSAVVNLNVITPVPTAIVSWEGVRNDNSAPTASPTYYNSVNSLTADNISGNNIGFVTNYSGFEGTNWPTGNDPDYTKYFQVAVRPKTGSSIDIGEFRFSQSGYCKSFEVRYSTEPSFPNNGTLALRVEISTNTEYRVPLNLSITENQTLYVRIYGFNKDHYNSPWRLNNQPYNLQTQQSQQIGPSFFGTVKPYESIVNWDGTKWSNGTGPTALLKSSISGPYSSNSADGGSFTTKQLNITSAGSLNIASGTSVTVINHIVNNGTLTVSSDANLIQVNDDAPANSGNITVLRDLKIASARTQYNYVGSPVSFAPGESLKTIYPGIQYALYYNEANNMFYTSSGANIPGRGLAVKEPVISTQVPLNSTVITAKYIGVPQNGVISFPLANSNASGSGPLGYNLLGNPYASNIDLKKLYDLNGGSASSNISATFYFWDNEVNKNIALAQQGSTYSGQAYAVYNVLAGPNGTGTSAAGYLNNNVTGKKVPTGIVKVGQGFLTKALVTNYTLKYNNSIRTASASANDFLGKSTNTEDNRFWLKMTAPSGLESTLAVVYFGGGNNFLGEEDSESRGGSDAIYTQLGDKKLAIDGREVFNDADVVSLGIQCFADGIYTIAIDQAEGVFGTTQDIYLKDRQTGTLTDLNRENYTFQAVAGETSGRFELRYLADAVLSTADLAKEEVSVYRNGNDFEVRAYSRISELQVYDAAGRLVYKAKPQLNTAKINGTVLQNGLYVVKVIQNGTITTKKILK